MSSHKISLRNIKPQSTTSYGSRTSITKANFPILQGMALYRLVIEEGCFREPHWHPNADELGYCTQGKLLVTIFSSGNEHNQFMIGKGEMFFIPSGSLHSLENMGQGSCECILSFSHESPEDFGLSGAVGCMSLEVMGNTLAQQVSSLKNLARSQEDILFGKALQKPLLSTSEVTAASFSNRLKFNIEASASLIQTDDGFAKLARKETWPILRSQAMYSLHLHGTGMREPHWHPETAELGYVQEGHGRMTVKSPDKKAETYLLEPGDIYFIPPAYPHHIENLSNQELHFLIFFDTPHVQDIGYTGALPAFPYRIIGPTLGLNLEEEPLIPKIANDLLIVKKLSQNVGS